MPRPNKLTKLIAVFDEFHQALASLDDPKAKGLAENWSSIRHQYLKPSGAPRSAFAAGMEEGLRETPMLLQAMNFEARKCAVQALAAATLAHYPDFLTRTPNASPRFRHEVLFAVKTNFTWSATMSISWRAIRVREKSSDCYMN